MYHLIRARYFPRVQSERKYVEVSFGEKLNYKALSPFSRKARKSPIVARRSPSFLTPLRRLDTANFNLPIIGSNPLFSRGRKVIRKKQPMYCKKHPKIVATSYCYRCKIDLCYKCKILHASHLGEETEKTNRCKDCNKKIKINDSVIFQEYLNSGLCHRCQNKFFTTPLPYKSNEPIAFKAEFSDFQELGLKAQLSFELEGKTWSSVDDYIQHKGVQDDIVKTALQAKIEQHPRLKQLLLSTCSREFLYYDSQERYWGVGFDGIGQNKLGEILKSLRNSLLSENV